MQFQSDIAGIQVQVPDLQELSGMGAAYAAGMATGLYDETAVYQHVQRRKYISSMDKQWQEARYAGWKKSVGQALSHG